MTLSNTEQECCNACIARTNCACWVYHSFSKVCYRLCECDSPTGNAGYTAGGTQLNNTAQDCACFITHFPTVVVFPSPSPIVASPSPALPPSPSPKAPSPKAPPPKPAPSPAVNYAYAVYFYNLLNAHVTLTPTPTMQSQQMVRQSQKRSCSYYHTQHTLPSTVQWCHTQPRCSLHARRQLPKRARNSAT